MLQRLASVPLAALLPVATAVAQDIHIDIGSQAGTPSSAYRAADDSLPPGAVPVAWNSVPANASGAPLVRADGSASGVSITITGGSAWALDHPGTSGDDQALLDDGSRSAGTQIITLSGMDAAECGLDYVYVLGADGAETTRVRLLYGPSPGGTAQYDGGGVWSGGHVEGVSYVRNVGDSYCDFVEGFDLVIEVSPAPGSAFGTVAGLQFTRYGGLYGPGFCNGFDGSLASCPCAPGAPQTGCDSPVPAMQGGGTTGGIGLFTLRQEFAPANRGTLFGYGFPTGSTPAGVLFRNRGFDPSSPVVFGDGLRCVDATTNPGSFTRLGAAVAVNGSSLHVIGHGATGAAGPGTFFYQLWFRSSPSSYCDPTAAFNTSSGAILNW